MFRCSCDKPRAGLRSSSPKAMWAAQRLRTETPEHAPSGQRLATTLGSNAASHGFDFSHVPIHADIDGMEEGDAVNEPVLRQEPAAEGPSDASDMKLQNDPSGPTAAKQGATTPCPTSVRVGALAHRNHSTESTANQARFRTWLGVMSRMDVGPGSDHSGHCMKEYLRTVSNNCPAAVYTRGGRQSEPCTGNRCLDINRYGSMWGVSDGPTAFLDMHRTRSAESLLEGTGVDACSVVCEQTYKCDRTHTTTGTFRITRNFRAGTHRLADGSQVHITTGTVEKT